MALSFGFYNSINSDRTYDAIQFGQIFDGIIKDGIYATYEKAMVVIASENAGEVIIQPGRAWFNHTWSYNDANLIISAPEPDILLERIDALVLDVNTELAFRENSFKWVEGTASSRPERPTLTNTVTHHQYPLCYIHRYPETTMIYTRDITNMVGTSECPFVTGVLEGLDIDMWINQWDDEFHTWETATRTQFEAWMVNQQEVYTAWFNSVRSEMEDNMTEFEAWFETIRGIIDEEAATHLQAEIDALAAMLPAGSHIDIHTTETTLYNRNVTVSDQAGHSKTVKFSAAGDATVESFPYVGLLDFTSTDGVQTASASITTPYFGRYALTMAFWAATCNLVSDETFAGIVVTVTDSLGDVKGAVTLDSEGSGVFTATYPDTYTFTLTYGGQTMEVSLAVTQETTYEVELHGGFRFDQWLVAGRVEEEFESLDEILEDEKTLRQLFLVHDSVDYMCDTYHDTQKVNEDYTKIFGCDLAAKWINLSDYALDKFYANEGIKAIMDTANKYGYGEWCLMPQVPAMTSNTVPSGEVFASSYDASYYAWKAFDGITNVSANAWQSKTGSEGEYVGYIFTEAKVIKRFSLTNKYTSGSGSVNAIKDFKLQASNDGTNWVDIQTFENPASTSAATTSFDITNNVAYTHYRLYVVSIYTATGSLATVGELQFYAWGPKGNVPIMTSDTAPYGTASATSSYNGSPAWKLFDGIPNQDNRWMTSTSATSWTNLYVRYKFVNPIKAKKVWCANASSWEHLSSMTYKIQGSNDASTWVDLYEANKTSSDPTVDEYMLLNNDNYYIYYQLIFTSISFTQTHYVSLWELQFYGRELKVSVPIMTSNTAPYGVASASSELSGRPAYRAFDGVYDNTTNHIWTANSVGAENIVWIQYHFSSAICVKKMDFVSNNPDRFSSIRLKGSNDGTNWSPITDDLTLPSSSGERKSYIINNGNAYSYYRLECVQPGVSGNIAILQFYGFDCSEKEFEVGTTKKWLYDHGVELENITPLIGQNGGTISKGIQNEIRISTVNALGNQTNKTFAAVRFNGIDLTPYSLIRFGSTGRDFYTVTNDNNVRIDLRSSDSVYTDGGTYADSVGQIGNKAIPYNELPNVLYYDCSSVNQLTYIHLASRWYNTTRCTFEELWLE